MADISITQQHNLAMPAARAAAQTVADRLKNEFGLTCRWEGDLLRFDGSGVEGALALGERQADVRIKLGFPMSMMASAIQQKVADKLRTTFA